jgi:hypothetical protein
VVVTDKLEVVAEVKIKAEPAEYSKVGVAK